MSFLVAGVLCSQLSGHLLESNCGVTNWPQWSHKCGILLGQNAMLFLCMSFAPLLACCRILQRRAQEAAAAEEAELKFESLSAAGCTCDTDQQRILSAIEGSEGKVVEAIRVLTKQGISTPE